MLFDGCNLAQLTA